MNRTDTSGKLLGRYRADVTSVKHPKGWHMAQVRLLVLWEVVPVGDLPWAEYLLPLGARVGEGDAMPCQVDDLVWVEFINGDTRTPIITGSCYRVTGDKSELPVELFESAYEHKRGDTEPAAPVAAYGDKVLELFGILHQITQNGAWCLTHKGTGTAFNITKDGELVLHAEANSHFSTTKDHSSTVGGKSTSTVTGDATNEFGAKLNIHVVGDAVVKSDGKMQVESGGDMALKSGGGLTLEAAGDVMLKGAKIGGETGSIYDFK